MSVAILYLFVMGLYGSTPIEPEVYQSMSACQRAGQHYVVKYGTTLQWGQNAQFRCEFGTMASLGHLILPSLTNE